MGGTMEYLSDLLGGGGSSSRRRYKKRKQFQTVELKVRMDCDGCELKVRIPLSSMKVDGDKQEAVQGDGAGVRGAAQGGEAGAGDGEEGGDLALRALHPRRPPLRRPGLRQEGSPRPRPPRRRRHARHRHLQLRRGAAHHHVQRREPQRLLHHVN